MVTAGPVKVTPEQAEAARLEVRLLHELGQPVDARLRVIAQAKPAAAGSTIERRAAGVAAAAPGASGAFTHRQIVTILVGLMLGMFLAALDQTVVATAIRTIADDLHGFDLQ